MSKLKNLKGINVKNKRVLMRVDFNVPSKEKLSKIQAVIPTLKYLIKNKAKIILISHLGRPNGRIVKELRLDGIAKSCGRLLKKKITKLNSVSGKKVQGVIERMNFGDIVMLENIRFYREEIKNSPKFAKELAKLGDIFINEAFAVSHRKHASVVGIPKYLPAAVGFLFEREIKELSRALYKLKHPLVIIIGGAKAATKIKVIEKFLKKADKILLGGVLANTVFAANDIEMGKSIIEKDMFKIVKKLDLDDLKFGLPSDFVCQGPEISIRSINNVRKNESAFDIGPRSVELFLESIKTAKMIIWNGPLGLVEEKPFDKASEVIAKVIAESKAYSIVGGGDTIAFIKKLGLEKKYNYISTGGGAMLDYLVNETLPGIEALKK